MPSLLPSKRLLFWSFGIAVLGLFVPFYPLFLLLWWGSVVALGLFSLIDLVALWRTPPPQIKRQLPRSWTLRRPDSVSLKLTNLAHRELRVVLYDHLPETFSSSQRPQSITLKKGTKSEVNDLVTPLKRGDALFSGIDLRLGSPFGLFWRQLHLAQKDPVRVFPDFKRIMKRSLIFSGHALKHRGVRQTPKRGEGLEFQELREYQVGDALRQIDWKSTARLRKVISRAYQEERDQRLIVMMDCGRRLRSENRHGTLFDQALDSILFLSHVALRQGDAVGFSAFNGDERVILPAKGERAFHHLVNQTYDLHPSPATFDFLAATQRILNHPYQRSLIVVVSRIGSEDESDLIAGLQRLRQRHLVLLVTLNEKSVQQLLDQSISHFEAALKYGAAKLYQDEREATLQRIRHEGGLLLDCLPEELPAALLSRYLEIKRASQL